MKKFLSLTALGLALSISAVHAADAPAAAAAPAAKAAPATAAAAAPVAAAPAAPASAPAAAPTKQQSKMATCNAEAGDKKGDERKAFMSECLKK